MCVWFLTVSQVVATLLLSKVTSSEEILALESDDLESTHLFRSRALYCWALSWLQCSTLPQQHIRSIVSTISVTSWCCHSWAFSVPSRPQLMPWDLLSANGPLVIELQIQWRLCFITHKSRKEVLLLCPATVLWTSRCSLASQCLTELEQNRLLKVCYQICLNSSTKYHLSWYLFCTLNMNLKWFKNQSFAVVATLRIFYRYKRTWIYIFLRILSKWKVSDKSSGKGIKLRFQLFDLVSQVWAIVKILFYSASAVHKV